MRPNLRVSLVFFLLFFLSLTFASSAAAFDPGDLDATFGIGGKVITDFFGNDVIQSLVIQSDGKIVVGGVSYSSPGTGDFALARYNTDGSLDTAFGAGGKVTTSFGSGVATVWSLAIYNSGPDAGKILAAGDTTAFGPNDFALARYNANGTLDTTFGAGGKVTTNIAGGSSDQVFAVALQGDHKIVVAGTSNPNAGGSWDFALARYNADGTLDTTNFGAGGKVLTDFGGGVDAATSVALQSDGKIVAAGYSANDFALARYNTDGSLDTATPFGVGGKVTTDFGANEYGFSVAIQSDGKIVVAGRKVTTGIGDFALARYNTDGSLDTATPFGAGGKVTTDFGSDDYGYSVALQSDGKIVVAGYSNASGTYDFALARYNTDGSLDTATPFGAGGKVTTDFGGSPDVAYSVAIQSDTKIVVAGNGGANGDFALARYYPASVLPTPVPGVGWPGYLALAFGFAALGALALIRRARGLGASPSARHYGTRA